MRPLVLADGDREDLQTARAVQVWVSGADGSRQRSVEIHGKGADEAKWTLHAEARAGFAGCGPPGSRTGPAWTG